MAKSSEPIDRRPSADAPVVYAAGREPAPPAAPVVSAGGANDTGNRPLTDLERRRNGLVKVTRIEVRMLSRGGLREGAEEFRRLADALAGLAQATEIDEVTAVTSGAEQVRRCRNFFLESNAKEEQVHADRYDHDPNAVIPLRSLARQRR